MQRIIHDFDQFFTNKIQSKYRPLSTKQNLFKSIIMNAFQNRRKMTNYRWTICAMLFLLLQLIISTVVLSLTWDEFIKPEFHWDESHYGTITSVFSIVYAICMLFAGRFVDWMGN